MPGGAAADAWVVVPRYWIVLAPLLLIGLLWVVISPTLETQHPDRTTLEGRWVAEGTVEESFGDSPAGTKVMREWKFERRCEAGRCVLWFSRQADEGIESAPLTGQGSRLTATFEVRARSCTPDRPGVVKRRFELLAEPEYGRVTAHSTTDGTYPRCNVDGSDQRRRSAYRWTARKA